MSFHTKAYQCAAPIGRVTCRLWFGSRTAAPEAGVTGGAEPLIPLKVTGSNPVPATTFIITHSPSRSNRGGLRFSGEGGAGDQVGQLTLRVTKCIRAPGRRRRAILLRR